MLNILLYTTSAAMGIAAGILAIRTIHMQREIRRAVNEYKNKPRKPHMGAYIKVSAFEHTASHPLEVRVDSSEIHWTHGLPKKMVLQVGANG